MRDEQVSNVASTDHPYQFPAIIGRGKASYSTKDLSKSRYCLFDFRYVPFFRSHTSIIVPSLGARSDVFPLLGKMAGSQKTSFVLYSWDAHENRQSGHDRPQLAPTPHLLPRPLPLHRPNYHPNDE